MLLSPIVALVTFGKCFAQFVRGSTLIGASPNRCESHALLIGIVRALSVALPPCHKHQRAHFKFESRNTLQKLAERRFNYQRVCFFLHSLEITITNSAFLSAVYDILPKVLKALCDYRQRRLPLASVGKRHKIGTYLLIITVNYYQFA